MTGVYDSLIIRFAARIQAPLLQLYALYVLAHGHYSPGGGFQAGAALAGSYLIPRIADGYGESDGLRGLTTRRSTYLALIGVMIYGGIGLLAMILGGNFLDYGALANLPWPMPHGGEVRAIGTLLIETGVTLTVMGVMITLYDDLVAKPRPGI